ncbi:MAG: polyprenyl synthetase family protein [Clostridiales Family XIII bacterium]|jgi:geranylgeranyl diphosphate synthase type II|nr:polyprenyl synthetase family protein [Clostridiales Family XIII bacterium]
MIDYPEYHRLKYLVEEHLLDFLPEIDSKSTALYDSMRYSLKAEGKRIRPVLLLAACELAGGETLQALPYACAIEYIHTYSLIHDDLPAMDDDDLRRGVPTNHKVYGEGTAILAGDGLLSSAFEAMNKDMLLYFDRPIDLKHRIRAAFEISKGCGCRGMIAGQIADIEAESKTISREFLDYIHINKTAALIESAIIAGAYIGGADAELLKSLRVYGENLGLAFQIADDILDVAGDETKTGKQTGRDDALHKATYPSLHGMDRSAQRLSALTDGAVGALARYRDDAEFFVEIAKALAERTA